MKYTKDYYESLSCACRWNDMDFEFSFEEDKDGQDINSKIEEVNNNKFRLDDGDTSASEGSDKKKDVLDAKLQANFGSVHLSV